MLQVDSSLINSGMQNMECVVFPPGRSKEAISLDATFKTIIPFNQKLNRININLKKKLI